MKRLLFVLTFMAMATHAHAQGIGNVTANTSQGGASVPATCNPGPPVAIWSVGNSVNPTFYLCGSDNVYHVVASGSAVGTVKSVAETFTGGLISVSGSPITTSGTLGLTVAGTSGGIPYFSGATTWASSGALTANLPVIGGGAGIAPTVGARSGNTTTFATTAGALTNGHCVDIDNNGNFADAGGACGVSGGGGTVTSVGLVGTANQVTVTGTSPIVGSGSWTLSIPTSPTLPGTTTGTFSGNLTGNVTGNVTGSSGSTTGNAATATALAANGTNCSAGSYPLGVDASGNSESCTAAATGTITGTITTGQIPVASSATALTSSANLAWASAGNGALNLTGGAGGTAQLNFQRSGDSGFRTRLANSTLSFGPGDGTTDVLLNRNASAVLALTGSMLFTSFWDMTETSSPGNPAASTQRVYADSTTHQLTCLTSSGGNCLPSGGGGGMAIGGTVTSGTSGSILFVGAGPVLAQDNANLFWDNTAKKFLVGPGGLPSTLFNVGRTIFTSGIANVQGTTGDYAMLQSSLNVLAQSNDNVGDGSILGFNVAANTLAGGAGPMASVQGGTIAATANGDTSFLTGLGISATTTAGTTGTATGLQLGVNVGTTTTTAIGLQIFDVVGATTNHSILAGAGKASFANNLSDESGQLNVENDVVDTSSAAPSAVNGQAFLTSDQAITRLIGVHGYAENTVMSNLNEAASGLFDVPGNTGGGTLVRGFGIHVRGDLAGAGSSGSAAITVDSQTMGTLALQTGTGPVQFGDTVQSTKFLTVTNCSSAASPAVCGSAASGSVVIAASATTVQVNTSAVTANSQIFVFPDETLGTKLSVTCNSTLATAASGLAITARSAGSSFTISTLATVAVNPVCLSYMIVN